MKVYLTIVGMEDKLQLHFRVALCTDSLCCIKRNSQTNYDDSQALFYNLRVVCLLSFDRDD